MARLRMAPPVGRKEPGPNSPFPGSWMRETRSLRRSAPPQSKKAPAHAEAFLKSVKTDQRPVETSIVLPSSRVT